MKKARQIMGSIIIFLDKIFPPRAVARSPEKQNEVDQDVKQRLVLYQFAACPFCLKVRRASKRLNLPLPLRDSLLPQYEKELLGGGGQRQVPCLRIQTGAGQFRWLYESVDIIKYLEESYR